MSEIQDQLSLISPDDEPRWSPEVEEQVESGVMTPLEADEQEGLIEAAPSASITTSEIMDDEEDKEIERLVSQGVGNYVSARAKVRKNTSSNQARRGTSGFRRRGGNARARVLGDTTSASDGTWSNLN